MHATIEQLLAIRDGEPVAAAIKQHVNICMLCHERLDELTLAQDELFRLPVREPSRDHWPEILGRVEHDSRLAKRRRGIIRYAGLGLAASVLLAVLIFIYQSSGQKFNLPQQSLPEVAYENTASSVPAGENNPDDISEYSLDELITRSAQLEAVLRAMPRRPKVIRASTADLITGLQDGVALIDYQINFGADNMPASQSRRLWQQRVDLMNSLVNVRFAETQRVAYSPN